MGFNSKSFGLGNLVANRFTPDLTPVASTTPASTNSTSNSTTTPVTHVETYSSIGSQCPLITEDVELKGELAFTGELEFNGRFEGTLDSDGAITVGERAIIKGNINASSAIISGKIQGNIIATGKVHVRSNAIVHGDIQATVIEIEEGASVNGKLSIKNDRETPNFGNIFTRLNSTGSKNNSKNNGSLSDLK